MADIGNEVSLHSLILHRGGYSLVDTVTDTVHSLCKIEIVAVHAGSVNLMLGITTCNNINSIHNFASYPGLVIQPYTHKHVDYEGNQSSCKSQKYQHQVKG